MEPHVEGGYFKECLLEKEERNLWSSIYFMLAKGEVSHFHRLKSDEVWYYHDGNALTIYMIDEAGKLTAAKLGLPSPSTTLMRTKGLSCQVSTRCSTSIRYTV